MSFDDAVRYYRMQGGFLSILDVRASVRRKLESGEIKIGEPRITKGEKLVLVDYGTRFAIEDTAT